VCVGHGRIGQSKELCGGAANEWISGKFCTLIDPSEIYVFCTVEVNIKACELTSGLNHCNTSLKNTNRSRKTFFRFIEYFKIPSISLVFPHSYLGKRNIFELNITNAF